MGVGKKGARVTKLQQEVGVFSIDVGSEGMVKIVGPDSGSVNNAKHALQLFSETVMISRGKVQWLLVDKAAALKQLESSSGLLKSSIGKEQGSEVSMELVGSAEAVIKAKVWMDVHLCEAVLDVTELVVDWLLESKAAVVKQLQDATGVGNVHVNVQAQTMSLVGTEESLAKAKEWFALRSHELLLSMDVSGALSLLLKNKAAGLKQLKDTTGLGRVSLDKNTQQLQLLGEQSALEAAREWLRENLTEQELALRPGFTRWLVGRRGASL